MPFSQAGKQVVWIQRVQGQLSGGERIGDTSNQHPKAPRKTDGGPVSNGVFTVTLFG